MPLAPHGRSINGALAYVLRRLRSWDRVLADLDGGPAHKFEHRFLDSAPIPPLVGAPYQPASQIMSVVQKIRFRSKIECYCP